MLVFNIVIACLFQNMCYGYTSQQPEQTRQFDSDFKDRYSNNKYNYEGKDIVTETPSGSGEYEDYKAAEDRRRERNDSDAFYINLGPLSWLFYLAIGLAVAYLVYILFNEGGSGLFSSRKHEKLKRYEDITAKNIEHTDIDALILNAEKDNDFRLAIRYYYLLVLKHLSLKNHIKFEDDKTNSEYLNDLLNTPFSDTFAYTSYLYNHIWYGKFTLDVEQYNTAKDNFLTLLKQVK